MEIRLSDLDFEEKGGLLARVLTPRPISWISTLSAAGVPNIAPVVSLACVATSPALVSVSFALRGGQHKDTHANIEATGEFVVNVVTRFLAEKMNESARETDPATDDFVRLGLTPAEIGGMKTPRIAECPAAFVCRRMSSQPLPPSKCHLIIAEVVAAYIADGFDVVGSEVLASSGPLLYATLTDVFALPKTWGLKN